MARWAACRVDGGDLPGELVGCRAGGGFAAIAAAACAWCGLSVTVHVVCFWSEKASSWAVLCLSESFERIEGMAERLASLADLEVCVVESPSFEDDDVEAAVSELEPPDWACEPNIRRSGVH